MDNDEILDCLLNKEHPGRPTKPDFIVDDDIWEMLVGMCWCVEPEKRGSASDVQNKLSAILEERQTLASSGRQIEEID